MGFALFDEDDQRVSGFCHSRTEAHHQRLQIMRRAAERAQVRPRPCMCCGVEFQSEHKFNRLCDVCRTGVPRMTR
ncbi:MAG: hypothetical protein Q4G49_17830 [Paracoccus sp. (in: a-proteobacteria)]|nr:hypothetical protein [Paracoccus sp. (in: a-proteobacteria)]